MNKVNFWRDARAQAENALKDHSWKGHFARALSRVKNCGWSVHPQATNFFRGSVGISPTAFWTFSAPRLPSRSSHRQTCQPTPSAAPFNPRGKSKQGINHLVCAHDGDLIQQELLAFSLMPEESNQTSRAIYEIPILFYFDLHPRLDGRCGSPLAGGYPTPNDDDT